MKDIEDDDPTLVELMLGGGLKPDTVQAKERMFKHFNEFVKKTTRKKRSKIFSSLQKEKGDWSFCLENISFA